jgi:hypothetical protein
VFGSLFRNIDLVCVFRVGGGKRKAFVSLAVAL